MDSDINKDQGSKSLTGFLKSWQFWKYVIGILTGASGGFMYYHFVGCKSGTCPITSHPFGSIIMGAVLGYLVTGMFETKK